MYTGNVLKERWWCQCVNISIRTAKLKLYRSACKYMYINTINSLGVTVTMTPAVTPPTVQVYTPESVLVTSLISSPNRVSPVVIISMTPDTTLEKDGRLIPDNIHGTMSVFRSSTVRSLGGARTMDSSIARVAGKQIIQ